MKKMSLTTCLILGALAVPAHASNDAKNDSNVSQIRLSGQTDLMQLFSSDLQGQSFQLVAQGMPAFTLTPTALTQHEAVNAVSSRGKIGTIGSYVFAQGPSGVVGGVWTTQGNWVIQNDANGQLIATAVQPMDTGCNGELQPTFLENEQPPQLQIGDASVLDSDPTGTDDGPLITRVLITYDFSALIRFSDMDAYAAALIESANMSYENSDITQTRLELAGILQVQNTVSNDSGVILRQLTNTSDIIYDELHRVRDALDADVVSHMTNITDFCGLGWLAPGAAGYALNLCDVDCAFGNLTFAHETGHNQGCTHDPDNAGSSYTPYGYGHRWADNSFRSVMAYSPGARVPHFSNPDVMYAFEPTGIANQRDNSRLLDETALMMSEMRVGDGSGADCDGDGTVDRLQIALNPELDLDRDGSIDACQVASDPALDCNGDGILDAVQARPPFEYVLGSTNFVAGGVPTFFEPDILLPEPATDVTVTVSVSGDLSSSSEYLMLEINDYPFDINMFVSGAVDCYAPGLSESITFPASQFSEYIDEGLSIRIIPSFGVDTNTCTYTHMNVKVSYLELNPELDANGDGRIDECSCFADFNGDDVVNFFDISDFIVAFQAMSPGADLNLDGNLNFFDVSEFLVSYNAGCP